MSTVVQPSSLGHLPPPSRKLFLKVVVIGDSDIGKTALLERYIKKRFTGTYKATRDTVVTMQVWDTAGQERYQSLNCTYYRGADACVLVFDKTNPASFEKLAYWRAEFLLQGDPADPDTFPFLVVGNKCDLESKVPSDTARRWCEANNITCKYFDTSARDDVNVAEAFREVAVVAARRAARSERFVHSPTTVALTAPPPTTKKSQSDCC